MSKRRKPLPDGEWMVWTSEWQGYRFDIVNPAGPREFRRGGSLVATWPRRANARVVSDWKTPPPLADDFPSDDSAKTCSRRVVDYLREQQLQNVEFLPLELLDRREKSISKDYFVVHPTVPIDCINLAASGAKLSSIRKVAINSVKKLVLATQRIPKSARLFRPLEFARVLLIERSLAEGLRALKADGLVFESLNKHWS